MTQQTLTDEQIRRAFERRAALNVPADLRRLVIAGVAAEPQRWGWQARAAQVVLRPDRRYAMTILVAVALLVATMVAIALIGRPAPLPQGSAERIAYISGGDLYVAGPTGESRLVWDSPEREALSKPMWVDAQTVIAMVHRAADGVDLVYLVDVATSTPRLVEYGSQPLALSPDHHRIATAHTNWGDYYRLRIVDLATGSIVNDLGELVSLTPLSWSPDDRWLLGEGSRYDTGKLIYRINLRAELETDRLSDLATGLCCGLHDLRPVLAPDGSRVVFVDYHQAADGDICGDLRCGTLWALDPVTGARQQLTAEEGSEIGPAFSPDGAWIAFMEWAGTGYDVAVVRADGTGRRTLTGTGGAFAATANGGPYRYLYWDADGKGVTFMRGSPEALEHELWHVTLDGQTEQRIGTFVVSEFSR